MTKVMTWNIGSFYPLRYLKFFGIKYKGQKIIHQYFQPKINSDLVSRFITQESPDIMFIQEIYYPEDLKYINILETYSYKKLVNSWYHEHSILIASKCEFFIVEKDVFKIISCNNVNYIPVHLNSFYALKRYDDFVVLNKLTADLSNIIILGDTNIWSRGNEFIFKNDKKAYKEITRNLVDFSKEIISTTYVGLGLDKVFGSKNLKVSNIKSPKIRGHFMDHYPIVFDLESW